jgi:hypothetical protein
MLLRAGEAEVEMRRSQTRLKPESFCEGRRRIGNLTLLSKNRSKIVPQVSTLGSELHGAVQLRGSLRLRIALAENAAERAVSFRILRRPRCCGAGLALSVPEISLLRKNTSEIQVGICKVRPEPQRGFEMTHGGVQFPLLREYPAQSGLKLSVSRGAPHRTFEIGARRSQIAFVKRFLPVLISEMSRRSGGRRCLSPRQETPDEESKQ